MTSHPRAIRPTRWMRVLGGGLAATFATFVAMVSHVLAGGTSPSIAAIMLSLALSIPVCVVLAGPALSLWRTSAAVAVTQSVFHLLFSGISSTGSITLSAHIGHNGDAISSVTDGAVAMGGHSASMWFAHGIAGLLTVVVLRHSESSLMRIHQTARLFLVSLTRVPTATALTGYPRATRIGCARKVLVRDLALLFSALRHRGPPALLPA